MSTFWNFITSEKVSGLLAVIAAIVMYFAPDEIDRIIETFLIAFGIPKLVITKTENK